MTDSADGARLERLQEVVRSVLRQPGLVIARDTTALDVDGWDSLAQARLMLAVEAQFGVTLPSERLFDLNCVGDLLDLLRDLQDDQGR